MDITPATAVPFAEIQSPLWVTTLNFPEIQLMRSFMYPAGASLLFAAGASAQVTLHAAINVDNVFEAFVSTDPDSAGTSFLSGANWPQTFAGSIVLPGAGTYYLNVRAVDQGAPMMFIGSFTLDSADATFQNGQQTLLTNTTDWTSSAAGFDAPGFAPIDLGANGVSPWGAFPSLGDARFIWHSDFPGTSYFTTVITVVPAPAAIAPLAALGFLAGRRRR
jgi:hypothetical protein